MAILTGKVYTSAQAGRDGITRSTTPDAFSGGFLRPCALIRERSFQPNTIVSDQIEKIFSYSQGFEIYLYEDVGYTSIDNAKARIIFLLYGYVFTSRFPAELTNIVTRQRDAGALTGASLERMDWLATGIYDI